MSNRKLNWRGKLKLVWYQLLVQQKEMLFPVMITSVLMCAWSPNKLQGFIYWGVQGEASLPNPQSYPTPPK